MKNVETYSHKEESLKKELDFLKMDVEVLGNWSFKWWLSWRSFVFNKWFEKVDPYTKGRYIDIDGKRYNRNIVLSKYYTWLWYRIWYNNSTEAWYLYVWQFEKNRFSGEWVCYWDNWNKYRWNRKNHKPTTWKVEFNNKKYDVIYEEWKWLKIISDCENKNKHIKLMTWEIVD